MAPGEATTDLMESIPEADTTQEVVGGVKKKIPRCFPDEFSKFKNNYFTYFHGFQENKIG